MDDLAYEIRRCADWQDRVYVCVEDLVDCLLLNASMLNEHDEAAVTMKLLAERLGEML